MWRGAMPMAGLFIGRPATGLYRIRVNVAGNGS